MKKKTLVIIGNGPSMKKSYLDLIKEKKLDSIGMNAAYRLYDKINWYPKFYCCFDYAVSETHKKEFERIIREKKVDKFFGLYKPSKKSAINGSFYLSENIRKSDIFQGFNDNGNTVNSELWGGKYNLSVGSTGANAIRIGISLEYNNFILLGCDANYNQNFNYNKKTNWLVEFKSDVDSNPNYWFEDYQKKGDLFHVPGNHQQQWNNLNSIIKKSGKDISITNCSMKSKINIWKKAEFEKTIKEL